MYSSTIRKSRWKKPYCFYLVIRYDDEQRWN